MALQPWSGCTIHPRLAGYEQEKNRSVCHSFCSRFSLYLPPPWSDPAKGHLITVELHQHNSDKMIPEGTRGHARGGAVVLKCLRYFWTKAGSHPTISLNKQNKHLTAERSLQCSWNSLLLHHVMICTGVFAPWKIQAIANRFCIKN